MTVEELVVVQQAKPFREENDFHEDEENNDEIKGIYDANVARSREEINRLQHVRKLDAQVIFKI